MIFVVGVVQESTPLVVPTISSGTDPWTVDVLLNNCILLGVARA